jgi:hypothetical protein
VSVPERSSLALVLIALGLGLVILGVLFWLGVLSWFGRLPGDIRVERSGLRLYVPITSMIIISVLLTLLMALIRRLGP